MLNLSVLQEMTQKIVLSDNVEIFHSLTVLAFMSHWAASLLIALRPVVGSLGG